MGADNASDINIWPGGIGVRVICSGKLRLQNGTTCNVAAHSGCELGPGWLIKARGVITERRQRVLVRSKRGRSRIITERKSKKCPGRRTSICGELNLTYGNGSARIGWGVRDRQPQTHKRSPRLSGRRRLLPWLALGAEYLALDFRMMFSWIWAHSLSLLHLQQKDRCEALLRCSVWADALMCHAEFEGKPQKKSKFYSIRQGSFSVKAHWRFTPEGSRNSKMHLYKCCLSSKVSYSLKQPSPTWRVFSFRVSYTLEKTVPLYSV